jgi:hypothetical protein
MVVERVRMSCCAAAAEGMSSSNVMWCGCCLVARNKERRERDVFSEVQVSGLAMFRRR